MLNLKSDAYSRAVSKASLLSPACTHIAGTLDFLVASTSDKTKNYLVTLPEPGILENATCTCPAGVNEQPSCVHRARAYLWLKEHRLCHFCHKPSTEEAGLVREAYYYTHPACSEAHYELVTKVSIPDTIPICSNCEWAEPLPGDDLCRLCLLEAAREFYGDTLYRAIFGS